MTARLDLSPDQRALVQAILAAHLPAGVAVRAFGSRATGTAKPWSDLDLALDGPAPLPLALIAQLAEAFDESALPFKVDLVDEAGVSPEFAAIIARDAIALERH